MDQNMMIQNQMTRITFSTSKLTMKTVMLALKFAIEYEKKDHKGINDLDKFIKNNADLDKVEIIDMNVKIMNKVCKQYNFKFATERLGINDDGKAEYAFYFNTSPQKASFIIQQYDIEVAKDLIRKQNYSQLIEDKENEREESKEKERTENREKFDKNQKEEDINKNHKDVSDSKDDKSDNFGEFDISDD